MNLVIAGIEITLMSAGEVDQRLENISDGVYLRMADGSGIRQITAWGAKKKTTITGQGWIPNGLKGVDFSAPVNVDCITEYSIQSPTNIIVIPGTVRPDYDPYGIALVNGKWINVGSSWAPPNLTIDATTGATEYQARWSPRLSMNMSETKDEYNNGGYGWSIYGEEA